MSQTLLLCIRAGRKYKCGNELSCIYHYAPDLDLMGFVDQTVLEAECADEPKPKIDDMKWFPAAQGLSTFSALRAQVTAGKNVVDAKDLPDFTIELNECVHALTKAAEGNQQFHLQMCL